MPFTKLLAYALFAASLTLLLSACGSLPEKSGEPAPVDTTGDPDKRPPSGLDITAPDENPYLAQAQDAPGAARAAFSDAVAAMQDERWRDARAILQQLTGDYPELSGPFLNLGIVHGHLGETELAEDAFAKAMEVNELNLEAYNQMALLKREAGDFQAAERHYLRALEVWPKHGPSHRNIGILYDLYMGQLEKALQHFEIYQYLQDEPDRQVAGWIIDLNRRLNDGAQAGAQP